MAFQARKTAAGLAHNQQGNFTMLFQELQDLTGGCATFAEYELVEKLYMASEAMTKKEAASIWKKAFGKIHAWKLKSRKQLIKDVVDAASPYRETPKHVLQLLKKAEEGLREAKRRNPCNYPYTFEDAFGITWKAHTDRQYNDFETHHYRICVCDHKGISHYAGRVYV